METSQIIATAMGTLVIVFLAFYFFHPSKGKAMEALQHNGTQHQRVIVKGGYAPNTIHLKRGVPTEIVFDRQEATSCSDEVILPDFGIKTSLPANQQTTVNFTPDKEGTFEFTCGMHMLRGTIVVEDAR
jgi:plastocyanin domain-containing protein